jgi:RNA polymerase sigma factor (sigma-70 family)
MSKVDVRRLLDTASERGSEHISLVPVLRQLVPSISARANRLAGGNDILREDLESAALMGVAEAVSRFECDRGVPLHAFAMQYATHRMSDVLRRESETGTAAVESSADPEVLIAVAIEFSPLNQLIALEFEDVIDECADLLRPRQGYVLRALLKRSLTQAEIARELGVSRMAVSKIVGELRKQVRIFAPFRDYLEAA